MVRVSLTQRCIRTKPATSRSSVAFTHRAPAYTALCVKITEEVFATIIRRITQVERHPVSSSNLQAVGYDHSTHVLEVEFTNGSVYQYFDVPQSIYQGLMAAPSKGSYLHTHIKDLYSYRQIE